MISTRTTPRGKPATGRTDVPRSPDVLPLEWLTEVVRQRPRRPSGGVAQTRNAMHRAHFRSSPAHGTTTSAVRPCCHSEPFPCSRRHAVTEWSAQMEVRPGKTLLQRHRDPRHHRDRRPPRSGAVCNVDLDEVSLLLRLRAYRVMTKWEYHGQAMYGENRDYI